MVISIDAYFGTYSGHEDAGPREWAAAEAMLDRVNRLLEQAEAEGVELETNPVTNSQVSGELNGGFRPQDCPIGAAHSSHKLARAVDIYDPHGKLDAWVTDEILTRYGLYREAPGATTGWCHLTDKPPGSGKRTFQP